MQHSDRNLLFVGADSQARKALSVALRNSFQLKIFTASCIPRAIRLLCEQDFAMIILAPCSLPTHLFELVTYWENHSAISAPLIIFSDKKPADELYGRATIVEKSSVTELVSLIGDLEIFQPRNPLSILRFVVN